MSLPSQTVIKSTFIGYKIQVATTHATEIYLETELQLGRFHVCNRSSLNIMHPETKESIAFFDLFVEGNQNLFYIIVDKVMMSLQRHLVKSIAKDKITIDRESVGQKLFIVCIDLLKQEVDKFAKAAHKNAMNPDIDSLFWAKFHLFEICAYFFMNFNRGSAQKKAQECYVEAIQQFNDLLTKTYSDFFDATVSIRLGRKISQLKDSVGEFKEGSELYAKITTNIGRRFG